MDELKKLDIEHSYKTMKGEKDHGHVTLIFHNEMKKEDFEKFVENNYKNNENKEYKVNIIGFARDQYCVAYLVKLSDGIDYYPPTKNLHITMMLNNKQPVYSNVLISRLQEKDHIMETDEKLVMFPNPITVNAKLKFNYQYMIVKPKVEPAQKIEKKNV